LAVPGTVPLTELVELLELSDAATATARAAAETPATPMVAPVERAAPPEPAASAAIALPATNTRAAARVVMILFIRVSSFFVAWIKTDFRDFSAELSRASPQGIVNRRRFANDLSIDLVHNSSMTHIP
jgi:hypothetical protein